MINSPLYNLDLNLNSLTYKLAPNVSLAQVNNSIGKLFQLKSNFQKTVLGSSPQTVVTKKNISELKLQLLNVGMPIRWVFVGLENGVIVSYPGHSSYNDSYDPRKRTWYTGVLESYGPVWGKMYLDASGQGLLLPCSMALRNKDNKFIGVVGVDISFDYLAHNLMKKRCDAVIDKYIVHGDGRILVTKSLMNDNRKLGVVNNNVVTEPLFPNAAVRDAIAKGKSGIIHDNNIIYLYSLIPTIGQYLVTKVDREKLFNQN